MQKVSNLVVYIGQQSKVRSHTLGARIWGKTQEQEVMNQGPGFKNLISGVPKLRTI